jgi:dimethylhistidine N-methyltransferase
MKIINLERGLLLSSKEQFALDVLRGLSSSPKKLYSKYFYDNIGSSLFQKITRNPDYYLTNKEYSVLEKESSKIALMSENTDVLDIIELGVGDGHKSRLIIDSFLALNIKINYYPIDISEQALIFLKDNLSYSHLLDVQGIVAEYFAGLSHIKASSNNPKLVLFLGSNIGNFNPQELLEFICNLWHYLSDKDQVLIGFDQKKDMQILHRAYNDYAGHTSEFNLNLLVRMNRELGANFLVNKFQHYGFYNPNLGSMESHLISLEEQCVKFRALKRSFVFKKFEPIHLEYSYKFLPADIERLCTQAGYSLINNFSDEDNYFINSLWRVNKTHE